MEKTLITDNLPHATEVRAASDELEKDQTQLDEVIRLIKINVSKGWISLNGLRPAVRKALTEKGYSVGDPQADRDDLDAPAVSQISWR